MSNLTVDQIRSSQAFQALRPEIQDRVVSMYDQSKGLDADPGTLSTRDLELFLAEHTPGEKAARAASFLNGQLNAGPQIQAPGGRAGKGVFSGKTWKDLLELESPTAKKEALALQNKCASLKQSDGAVGFTDDASWATLAKLGTVTLRDRSHPVSGAFLADRLDAAEPERRTEFMERYGIIRQDDQYLLPIALTVTEGFVVEAGSSVGSVWQGLIAQGFSEQQIANNPELLAWVAQKNDISDFRSIANGQKIQTPVPEQLDGIVNAVRTDLLSFGDGIVAVYADAARSFVADLDATSSTSAKQLWNDSQAKKASELMFALHDMEMDQIRQIR